MRPAAIGAFPIEPVEGHDQPPFRRPPMNVADPDHGVLQMGGDDLEIVAIECCQL